MQCSITAQPVGVSETFGAEQYRDQKRSKRDRGVDLIRRSPANRHALPNFLYKSNLAEVGDEDRYAAERGNRSAGLPQNQPLIR